MVVAVAVAVSEGGAVAMAVAGLTKRFLNQCLGLCSAHGDAGVHESLLHHRSTSMAFN